MGADCSHAVVMWPRNKDEVFYTGTFGVVSSYTRVCYLTLAFVRGMS
jgi:hypothetical protein